MVTRQLGSDVTTALRQATSSPTAPEGGNQEIGTKRHNLAVYKIKGAGEVQKGAVGEVELEEEKEGAMTKTKIADGSKEARQRGSRTSKRRVTLMRTRTQRRIFSKGWF